MMSNVYRTEAATESLEAKLLEARLREVISKQFKLKRKVMEKGKITDMYIIYRNNTRSNMALVDIRLLKCNRNVKNITQLKD